jgi:TRAP-type transport system periplasmic protein
MRTTAIFSAVLAAFSLATAPGLAVAQDKTPIEIRYSSAAPPAGNPWAMQINRFAKDVEEESKGGLKISPFFANQLGSEQDTVQQVARGRIDMGGYSSGSAALIVPEIGLLVMPFYFKNPEEQDCVLDNHLTKPVAELYAKKGVQFLGWTEVGTIDFFGKKAFPNPKDLAGVKAISYANKTQALFFSSLGANPNPMGIPEWIPAFQTGLGEVVMTPITLALPSGLSKVATVATRAALYDSPSLSLMNKGVYDKLSKEHQEAIVRATARHPSSKYRAEVRGFETVLYGMHEKAGGTSVTITADQRAAWRKAMEPIFPQIVKETGSGAETFFAAMEAGRKACSK